MPWRSPGERAFGSMTLSVRGSMSAIILNFIRCTSCTSGSAEPCRLTHLTDREQNRPISNHPAGPQSPEAATQCLGAAHRDGQGTIVLANLAKGRVGEDVAALLGSLLVNQMELARGGIVPRAHRFSRSIFKRKSGCLIGRGLAGFDLESDL